MHSKSRPKNGAGSPYRLENAAKPKRKSAKAEMQLGEGVSAGAETESADVGGFTSNRVMLRLKVKF